MVPKHPYSLNLSSFNYSLFYQNPAQWLQFVNYREHTSCDKPTEGSVSQKLLALFPVIGTMSPSGNYKSKQKMASNLLSMTFFD